MGWDRWTDSEPCPCGEGKITQKVEENDWMKKVYHRKVIECPKCKIEYEWKSTQQMDGKTGRTYTTSVLVRKDSENSEE